MNSLGFLMFYIDFEITTAEITLGRSGGNRTCLNKKPTLSEVPERPHVISSVFTPKSMRSIGVRVLFNDFVVTLAEILHRHSGAAKHAVKTIIF